VREAAMAGYQMPRYRGLAVLVSSYRFMSCGRREATSIKTPGKG
jgi:hypothetical protein